MQFVMTKPKHFSAVRVVFPCLSPCDLAWNGCYNITDQLDEDSLTSGWQLYPACDASLLSGFTGSSSCQEEEACSKIYALFSCGQGGSIPISNYPLARGQKRMCGYWKHPLSEQLFKDSSKKKVSSRLEVRHSWDPPFGTVLSCIVSLE